MKGLKYKLIIVIAIICATTFIFISLMGKNEISQENSYVSSGDSDFVDSTINADDNFSEKNEDELKNQSGDFKNIALVGFKNLRIKSSRVDVNVNFTNPKENSGLCYQVFELHLINENGETTEVLYESDFVKPGDSLKRVNLTRAIEKGEYDAMLWIKSFLMDANKTPTNDAKFKIKLIAE